MAPMLELLLDLVEELMGMVLATGCPLIDTTWRLLRPSPLQQGPRLSTQQAAACTRARSEQQRALGRQQVLNAGQLTK